MITLNDVLLSAKEVFEIEANSILKLSDRLDKNFLDAIEIIYNSKGKVVVTGMGKSGLVGRKIASTLCSTGTPAVFLHPAESTHGDSGIISRGDVVIAISNSGETGELLNLLPLLHRFNVPVISMTGNLNSTLAKMGSVVIDISVEKEACPLGKAPTASTTATLAMGDAIAVCLLKKRGFTTEDFLLYHPSGALGKGILYTVEELMLKGENVPLISEKVDFKEALTFITEKKLGTAIIINENGVLTGVLTDGDIRRILIKYDNISNLKLQDVMTRNPKTISKVDLCAKALSIMERHSITSLAVVDDNQIPIGIIHIHDLLKAGVA
ncbi:MAG: KpsF/GutQ family sugar-phosphate isomerase [Cyanobacteria bacterium SIG30]|nr:KpsF/GutQ family sugar-phosphate isomerase [Cyanobacteria bacterium SIG30]